MKSCKVLLIILVSLISYSGFAQTPIVTDRPDATEASNVMDPGAFQIETGYLNTCFNGKHQSAGDALFRIGFFKGTELRLINTYQFGDEGISGFGPLKTGMKMALRDEIGKWPAVSFLGHVTFDNFGDEQQRPNNITPDFRFLMSKTINDIFSVAWNLGMEWDGVTSVSRPLYTCSFGAAITDWLGAYSEVFGYFPEDQGPEHSFNAGFIVWLIEDVQLDAYIGKGLNDRVVDNFFGMGVSWRAFK